MFYEGGPLLYVWRTLLYFACFGAKGISLCVTVRNGVIVIFNDCRVLTFRVRRLGVITVNLPWVTGVKPRYRFRILSFRTTVLRDRAYVSLLTTTVAVRCIGSCHCSNVRSWVTSSTIHVSIVLVGNVSVSNV